MKKLFTGGLRIACLSLYFLMPQGALASDSSTVEDSVEAFVEENAYRAMPSPYESAADIPEGVNEYVTANMMVIGMETALKIMGCTSQLDPDSFADAWEDLQSHLVNLTMEESSDFASRIESDRLKMFLNFLPHDADYTLDIFFQQNQGSTGVLPEEIKILQAQIADEADEGLKASLQHELLYLNKCLYAANNPRPRTMTGELLFGGLIHPLLEQAFLEKAAEEIDTQFKIFVARTTEINARTALIANTFTLLRETYRAGVVALSHIITAGEDVTTEQADCYMNLANFYHPMYKDFLQGRLDTEAFLTAYQDFGVLILGLTYFAQDENGHAIEQRFPEPDLVTVSSEDDAADVEAEASITASQEKQATTNELTAEMNAISAQLADIAARREAAGDDVDALAAVEADKSAILERIQEIQDELTSL